MDDREGKKTEYRFLVAFSFAGEQRMQYVRPLAEALRDRLGDGRVFLDEWYVHEIAGLAGDDKLASIYREQSLLIIPCVSEDYGNKPWTQTELNAIKGLIMALRKKGSGELDRILPLRVGDGDVPGIYENAICPKLCEMEIPDAVDLIVKRLGLVGVAADHLPNTSNVPDPREQVDPDRELRRRETTRQEVEDIYADTSAAIDEILQHNETVGLTLQEYFPTMVTENAGSWQLAQAFRASRFDLSEVLQAIARGLNRSDSIRKFAAGDCDDMKNVVGGIAVLGVTPEWVLANRAEIDSKTITAPTVENPRKYPVGKRTVNILELFTSALVGSIASLEKMFGTAPDVEPTTDRIIEHLPVDFKGTARQDVEHAMKKHFVMHVQAGAYDVGKIHEIEYVNERFRDVLEEMEIARHDDGEPYVAFGDAFESHSEVLKRGLKMSDLLIMCPSRRGRQFLDRPMRVIRFLEEIHEQLRRMRQAN